MKFLNKRFIFYYDASNYYLILNNNLKFKIYLKLLFKTNKKIIYLSLLKISFLFVLKNYLNVAKYMFFKLIKVYGLGFKLSLSSKNLIKLDMGWSHALFLKIPENLFILKKQDTFLIYSFSQKLVSNFSYILISLYKRTAYQIKGIFYIHEYLKKKIGKQRQK